jgi:Rrf2 family protein
MQITRGTDYAVRLMVHLATLPEGTRVPVTEFARVGGAPETFISKLLQRLVRIGMLSSSRGTGGGFMLAIQPRNVTLLDVVEAIEGPLQINRCLPGQHTCNRKSICSVHPVWEDAQTALKNVLQGTSIEKLARESVKNSSAWCAGTATVRPHKIGKSSTQDRSG